MNQAKLRLMLYCCWVASLLVSVLILLLGPSFRRDGAIGFEQVYAVIPAAIGLHLPALSAFAAFWFPQEERRRAQLAAISLERAIGGTSLTIVYLLIVLSLIYWPTFVISYKSPDINLPESQSFAARINDAVKTSLMLSPIAMAPAAFITRLRPPAAPRP